MKKLLIWLPGMLSMLAACTEAVEIPARAPEKQSPVRVELHLTTEQQQAATRAMDENCIRDVNLYLYGDTEYHFYFPSVSSPLVFNVLPGNYRSYAIANAGQDLGDKNAFKIQFYETAVDVMVSSDAIPMTDRGTLAVDGAGRCTPSSLRVTRSAAKIAYTIEVADAVAPSLSLRSVQFCNLPRTIRPFDSGSISSTVEANYYDGEAMPVGNERRTAGTAYLFENLQGSVDTITDQKDKCPENAPACATYLRILAERSTDKALVEYIVYPGENNTSDFNVRRNTWHNLELVIRGENEIDNRVLVYDGLYYGTANCHICTGDQVTFDVTPYRTSRSRNYAYLGIEAGDEYAPASAGLLWQDNKIITGFTLADNRLTVHTNGQRGNALVAVYDAGGTILWSWHIWCLPGDRPQDDRYTNRAGEQFLVMDRNLGAIGTDLKTRYGLVYTWGRKDPFTSNEVYNAAGRKDRFINHWPTIYTTNESEAKTYDLTYMTRHPTTYVYTGWYAKLYTHYDNALWGDPAPVDTYGWASAKSVHDPCPEGYRLPSRYTWTAFENYVFPGEPYVVGAFDNGYWFQRFRGDTKGTFYPVPVGNDDFWLDRDGVAVMLTGAASEPTSATPYPTVYFKFEINSGWTNFEGGKGKGLVRCVRE